MLHGLHGNCTDYNFLSSVMSPSFPEMGSHLIFSCCKNSSDYRSMIQWIPLSYTHLSSIIVLPLLFIYLFLKPSILTLLGLFLWYLPHPLSLSSASPLFFPLSQHSLSLSLSDSDKLPAGLGNPSCRIPHLNTHSLMPSHSSLFSLSFPPLFPIHPFFPPVSFHPKVSEAHWGGTEGKDLPDISCLYMCAHTLRSR